MSKPRPLPSIKELAQLFTVDPCSPSGLRRPNGAVAGTLHADGRYWYAKASGQRFACHRIILALATGEDRQGFTVDHINRDGLDNRVENLRWATPKEQAKNRQSRRKTYPKKWGYRWVKFDKNGFVAIYRLNGKEHYAGRFKSAAKAHYMACAHRLETFWRIDAPFAVEAA